MSDNLIQVYTVYIEAPASKVWEAITTSEYTNQWGYGGDTEYEFTPGGKYCNYTTDAMKAMGLGEVAISGTVISVEVGKRLEISWQATWHPDAPATVLTWELTEFDGPLTRVVLTHDVTAFPELANEVAGGGQPDQGGGGWPWILASLKTLVETGRPMVGSGS